MHVRPQVVWYIKTLYLSPRTLLEVVQLASGDVERVDHHVFVPVRSALLVPEAHGVAHLVGYGTVLQENTLCFDS